MNFEILTFVDDTQTLTALAFPCKLQVFPCKLQVLNYHWFSSLCPEFFQCSQIIMHYIKQG